MKIQPRNEYVIVHRQVAEQKAIIIPGQETDTNLAIVDAVGPGGLTATGGRNPIEISAGVALQPGDVVFLGGGEYETYLDGSQVHLIVPQSAILGVQITDTND